MSVFLYIQIYIHIHIYIYIYSLRGPSHSIATARRQRHNRKEEMKIIGQCSCSLLSGRLWVAIGRLWVALGRLWELLGGSGSSWAALGRLLAGSWAAWAAPGGSGSSWAAFGQFLDDSWAALARLLAALRGSCAHHACSRVFHAFSCDSRRTATRNNHLQRPQLTLYKPKHNTKIRKNLKEKNTTA